MTPSPEFILSVIVVSVPVIGSYAVIRWQLTSVWSEMTKLREWRQTHEKESADARLEFARQISEIRIANAKTDVRIEEKFSAILDVLNGIRHDLDRLKDAKQ